MNDCHVLFSYIFRINLVVNLDLYHSSLFFNGATLRRVRIGKGYEFSGRKMEHGAQLSRSVFQTFIA